MSDASLRGADLTGSVLNFANLRRVDATGATLTGASLYYGDEVKKGENVTILRTKRLTLRPVQSEDAPAFEAFYGDADVMSIRKYGVLDPAVARTQVREMLQHWRTHGFGMWVVTDIATGAFAGECGLRWLEDRTDVELSYGLYPRFRGRGLATEAARAIVDYGIGLLELGRIVALSRGDNTASHRILENLGMTLEWRRPSEPHGLVKYVLLTRMYTSPNKVVGTDP